MNTLISGASAAAYRRAVKPLLFKQKPDAVHNHLLHVGRRLQHIAPARGLLKASWAYQNPGLLGQTVQGIYFKNPVGLSAGFDKNFELPLLLKSIGFGFMEGGSLTYRECAGNPRPWFYRLPKTKSIVVYAGLANQGAPTIVRRIKHYSKNTFKDFPLNISVAKTNSPEACTDTQAVADYLGSLGMIKAAGVGDVVTLNISCPNTYGGEPFTTPERLERLLRAVDRLLLPCPVFVKMPCDLPWPQFRSLLDVIVEHRVAGVTISNLAKDRGRLKLMDPLPDSVKGNLSGKPTWELSNELIRRTYKVYGKRLTIIGVGGIFSAEDAYTKICLGASLVELITGMIFEGPQLIGHINRGLAELLKHDGYANVSQAVGSHV
ncbi:MAG TPA: quinone-dependent dihydroorotate dehydrogenase [Candidatus Saccharimonadales bacterium]|nr:quinone-dependent dihydroorotate dehydrogenase [Candidatus Saccharimonadales bacterium]